MSRAYAAAEPQSATLRGLPSRRTTDPGRAARTEAVDETALALAHRIVELASDKKASDIVLLDVRAQTAMADYFVICSGASDRQLGAIAEGIIEGAKEGGRLPDRARGRGRVALGAHRLRQRHRPRHERPGARVLPAREALVRRLPPPARPLIRPAVAESPGGRGTSGSWGPVTGPPSIPLVRPTPDSVAERGPAER